MKYEAPQLTAMTPAISAIQDVNISKLVTNDEDSDLRHGAMTAYSDWE